MLIVDSKSIQNADTAGAKSYDAEKKSGIKLHIGVDTLGLLYTILVTTATDRNGAIIIIGRYRNIIKNLSSLKKVLVDGGYTGEKFANAIKSICDAEI